MKKQHLAATALACVVAATLMVGATVAPQETAAATSSLNTAGVTAQQAVEFVAGEAENIKAAVDQAAEEQAAEKQAAEMEAARKAAQAANTSFRSSQNDDTNRAVTSSGKSGNTPSRETSASTRTITIDGVTMSYSDSYGTSSAPNSGAGIWKGSDSTTDGSYSYYIGHNPGSFNAAANASNGSQITVNDSDGNSRTYTVVDTFVVSRDSTWGDVSDRVTSHGESVALQTCVEDGYRIIVAS